MNDRCNDSCNCPLMVERDGTPIRRLCVEDTQEFEAVTDDDA